MSLEISYYRTVATNGQVAKKPFQSESLALSSSPASAVATPQNCGAMSLTATEAARYEYTGVASAVTATSHYIAAGERVWLDPEATWTISARTA